MESNIAYALCEVNFDYNDEQYSQNGLSSIVKAFKTKEAAITEVGKLAANDFKNCNVVEYFEEELYNIKYRTAHTYIKDLCSVQYSELADLIDDGVWDNQKEITEKFAEILSLLPDYDAGEFLI